MHKATLDHYNADADPQLWRQFREFLISGLRLSNNYRNTTDATTSSSVRITIIQRQRDRVFLDLDSLLKEIDSLLPKIKGFPSFDWRVVMFEGMGIRQQAAAMSETDILIDADGTGIMNGIYLPLGSCVISFLPYGVKALLPFKGKNFETLFTKLGMPYHVLHSLAVPGSEETVRKAKAKKAYLKRWFMLKQDLKVNSTQLVSAIHSCVATPKYT